MLIIVEGPNGAGKTTIANQLRRIADAIGEATTVLHAGPPTTDDAVEEYIGPLRDYEPASGHTIICDRWHLGELVYGPLLRGHSRLDACDFAQVEQYLLDRGAVVVRCFPPREVIHHRLERRDGSTEDLLPDEIHAFGEAFAASRLPQSRSARDAVALARWREHQAADRYRRANGATTQ